MTNESPQADITVSVHACNGVTASARLAQDVAERLRGLTAEGSIGVQVVAIDGCGSACSSRRLAGQGVETLAVSLETLGVELGADLDEEQRDALADEIAVKLSQGRPARELAPRGRQEPPAPSAASATDVHTADDYLFAISLLAAPVGACGVVASDVPALAAHVARSLGVSRAAAGEMLGRMEDAGQVERGPDRAVVLTADGRADADRILRRHRIVERFLAASLGYTPGQAHSLALEIRGSFPDEAIERLRTLVSPATTCPHGWPLEPGTGIEIAPDLVAVSALAVGDRRAVAALAEHERQLLERLCELGVLPGADVEILAHGDQLEVRIDGRELMLGPAEAAAVLVRLRTR